MQKKPDCECPLCMYQIDFELSEFLINEILLGNAVIFAGAGVSTENPNSAPHSLYTELATEIGIRNCTLPFPDLTQQFSQKPDGRFELLKHIQARFDYIYKFAGLREQSTKFHQELATMPYFRTFITTNWDRYFEDNCHAKPFVYDTDMRFWEVPHRRVLKIHGTIDDYSSLVVTRDDYNRCSTELQCSLIGAKLKDLLTTKTCIFIGYSMDDDDFKEIFEFVGTQQGKFKKTHYFVSPNIDNSAQYNNISPIRTDGTYFLKVVKEHLCSINGYFDDYIYDQVEDELCKVEDEHIEIWGKYNPIEHPQILPSAIYQDGLIHGYQIIRDLKGTGHYSDPDFVDKKILGYETKIANCRSKRNYLDVAYFSGFQNALIALATLSMESNQILFPPRYYFEKVGAMNQTEFKESFEELPNLHKGAFKQCEKIASRLPADNNFVIQHPPWG